MDLSAVPVVCPNPVEGNREYNQEAGDVTLPASREAGRHMYEIVADPVLWKMNRSL